MKKVVIFCAFFFISLFSAQKLLDLKAIENSVNDSLSPYFYEKLVYKFNYDPNIITAAEAEYLYYGKLYADYKSYNVKSASAAKEQLNKLTGDQNYAQVALEGEALIRLIPADMEVLGLLMYAYLQQNLGNKELTFLRAAQFKKLIDAVFSNRQGDDQHPVFTVTSIADEYVLAGILNLDLKNFHRKTTFNDNGVLDYWKKGSNKISFQVIDHFRNIE